MATPAHGDAVRRELLSGATAGVANVLSGFPLDTLKVKLQTEPGKHRGLWSCFTHVVRHEGVGS
jgi:hypothetical protein